MATKGNIWMNRYGKRKPKVVSSVWEISNDLWWFTIREASILFRVSTMTIRYWFFKGFIEGCRIGPKGITLVGISKNFLKKKLVLSDEKR
jgi:hypothetical protein